MASSMWCTSVVHTMVPVFVLLQMTATTQLTVVPAHNPCEEGKFNSSNGECTPCTTCAAGVQVVHPCTRITDPLCDDISTIHFPCNGSVGIFFEDENYVLQQLHGRKLKKMERRSCHLAQRHVEKVQEKKRGGKKQVTGGKLTCPGPDHYVWKYKTPRHSKNITQPICRRCSKCKKGSEVLRPCAGMHDTVCSFPGVPGAAAFFETSCFTTSVRVYSEKLPVATTFRIRDVERQLGLHLCHSWMEHIRFSNYNSGGSVSPSNVPPVNTTYSTDVTYSDSSWTSSPAGTSTSLVVTSVTVDTTTPDSMPIVITLITGLTLAICLTASLLLWICKQRQRRKGYRSGKCDVSQDWNFVGFSSQNTLSQENCISLQHTNIRNILKYDHLKPNHQPKGESSGSSGYFTASGEILITNVAIPLENDQYSVNSLLSLRQSCGGSDGVTEAPGNVCTAHRPPEQPIVDAFGLPPFPTTLANKTLDAAQVVYEKEFTDFCHVENESVQPTSSESSSGSSLWDSPSQSGYSTVSSTSDTSSMFMPFRNVRNDLKPAALCDQLQKVLGVESENFLSTYTSPAMTQTDDTCCALENFRPKPIFSSSWQGRESFSSAGGSLALVHSSLRLEVPVRAVPPAVFVDVVAATFTNLPQVRQVLQIASDEYIVSPAVELYAGTDFMFQKLVHIFIPHSLPSLLPEDYVRVYHFEDKGGKLVIKRVLSKTAYDSLLRADKMHITSGPRICRDEETGLEFAPCYFQLLPSGELRVTTMGFCGFVCTVCGQYVNFKPELHLVATVSKRQLAEVQWQENVFLYLWDKKINVKDFQRDYLPNQKIVEDNTMTLVDNFQQSMVRLELTLSESSSTSWFHVIHPAKRVPVYPETRQFPLKTLLHCQALDTPRKEQWLMKNTPGCLPDSEFECYIDVINISEEHVGAEATPTESGATQSVTLLVQDSPCHAQRPDSADPSKREARGREHPDQPEHNTRLDSQRRNPSVVPANCPPASPVSSTPAGVQEEAGIDSRLIFGDGRAVDFNPQAPPCHGDPTVNLTPDDRASRPRSEETENRSHTRLDDLKPCRVSDPAHRNGQEHNEIEQLSETPRNTSASCPDDLMTCTNYYCRRQPGLHCRSSSCGMEANRKRHKQDVVNCCNNADLDMQGLVGVSEAGRAREARAWSRLTDTESASTNGRRSEKKGIRTDTQERVPPLYVHPTPGLTHAPTHHVSPHLYHPSQPSNTAGSCVQSDLLNLDGAAVVDVRPSSPNFDKDEEHCG